jgi:carbamoyl-phosphate synthase large subunit
MGGQADMARVLVTGVGGDLGQAIVKALRLSARDLWICGCDMDSTGTGPAFVDEFQQVPAATRLEYVMALSDVCKGMAVEAVIPSTDAEIQVLSRLGRLPRLPSGSRVVCHGQAFVDTFGDKRGCMQALADKVELVPWAAGHDKSAIEALIAQSGYPLVVKPSRSSGSKGMRLVENRPALAHALRIVDEPVVQAYIEDRAGEFSVGLFACKWFTTAIAFKRDLGPGGCSWYAETVHDKDVLAYALEIAKAIRLAGAANVQVRRGAAGVRLLEVNVRFSSLVAARAACGFRDAEWWLDLALGNTPERPQGDYKNIRFCRFPHEVVDFGAGYAAVPEWTPKGAR